MFSPRIGGHTPALVLQRGSSKGRSCGTTIRGAPERSSGVSAMGSSAQHHRARYGGEPSARSPPSGGPVGQAESPQGEGVHGDEDARARHGDRRDFGAQSEADRDEDAGGDRQRQRVVPDRPPQVL